MRSEIVGLGLAAILLGGLFFAATHRAEHVDEKTRVVRPGIDRAAVKAAAQSIEKGFVGIKRVGAWTVACTPKPLIVGGQPSAAGSGHIPLNMDGEASGKSRPKPPTGPAAKPPKGPDTAARQISLGRCRSLIEFRRKKAPKKVVLALIFRLAGAAPGKLVLFARVPTGKVGEKVRLRVGKRALELPVKGCASGGCTAVGVLAPATEAALSGAAKGGLILPPGPDGKRKVIRLPLAGLAGSLSALRRAQS